MTSNASADDVVIRPDITYATHDGIDMKGDLVLPKGDGPFPLLMTLPGGAWRQCNRRNHHGWARYLASHGYAVFTAEYRVASFDRKAFPEAAHDAIAAIRFVRGNARDLKIDPDRIAILGTSAGAHLASLVALAADVPPFANGYPSDRFAEVSAHVKALIAVYGIYDLFAHWQYDLRMNPGPHGNLARNFLGKEPFENQRLYFDASPLRHVSYAKNKMPVLLSWGTNDDAVNPHQSELFLEALQQARFDVRAHRLVGATHFWFNQSPIEPGSESAFFAPRLLAFLKTHL